jgi:hypothetical protein
MIRPQLKRTKEEKPDKLNINNTGFSEKYKK